MDDTDNAVLIPTLELGQVLEDRERLVRRLVLSLALDPPKALERGRRTRPLSMRRLPGGR